MYQYFLLRYGSGSWVLQNVSFTGFSQKQNGSSQKNIPQKETNIKAAVLPGAAALFVKEWDYDKRNVNWFRDL